MDFYHPEDRLYSSAKTWIENKGYSLLSCKYRKVAESWQVRLIIHSARGVGIEDCAKIYRLLLPLFIELLESEKIVLEVSSPGLSRKIEYGCEFLCFKGRLARVKRFGGDFWLTGVIADADADFLQIKTESDKKIEKIVMATIGKAVLEDRKISGG